VASSFTAGDHSEDIPEADLYYFWLSPLPSGNSLKNPSSFLEEHLTHQIPKGKIARIKLASEGHPWYRGRPKWRKMFRSQEYIEFIPKENDEFPPHGVPRHRRVRRFGYHEKTPLTLGILDKGNL
jgi:hypothetical protein